MNEECRTSRQGGNVRHAKKTLRKSERIQKSDKFDEIFKRGKFFSGSYVNLVFRKHTHRRVGFALSKGIKGSVRRNRLKRILRELYRKKKEDLREDVELILIAREDAFGKPYHEMKKDLELLLKEAGLLRK